MEKRSVSDSKFSSTPGVDGNWGEGLPNDEFANANASDLEVGSSEATTEALSYSAGNPRNNPDRQALHQRNL